MRTHSPLFLLTALGVLSAAGTAAAADSGTVDTSEWKCESCPFPKKGTSGAIDVGLAAVSDASAKFGDYTGLQRQGVDQGLQDQRHADVGELGGDQASKRDEHAPAPGPDVGHQLGERLPVRSRRSLA